MPYPGDAGGYLGAIEQAVGDIGNDGVGQVAVDDASDEVAEVFRRIERRYGEAVGGVGAEPGHGAAGALSEGFFEHVVPGLAAAVDGGAIVVGVKDDLVDGIGIIGRNDYGHDSLQNEA